MPAYMQNVDDFVRTYNGKGIDVDHYPANNPYQCTDVVAQFCKDSHWPHISGNANQLAQHAPQSAYQWIRNSPRNKPNPGDILILNLGGAYGHCGIVTSANYINVSYFNQNAPLGSLCHISTAVLYRGVIGWLHAR